VDNKLKFQSRNMTRGR